MRFIVQPGGLKGRVRIPASKSHTVRAALFATLADGRSVIHNPLDSLDAQAAVATGRAFGARFEVQPDRWVVDGVGGALAPPEDVIDVGNSGTTLYIALALAGLIDGGTVFTGDDQIRRRSAESLLQALNDLGARAWSTRGNGCCPICVRGPLLGGETSVRAITSQYVTAILMAAPLARGATTLHVTDLNEAPYVGMTLNWLDRLGIRYESADDYSRFHVPGGQRYGAFERAVPADFSSATFFLGAGAVLEGGLTLEGLDMSDTQGDKAVVDYLRAMGADIQTEAGPDGAIAVGRSDLQGREIDLNATPDALPMMAVVAALARGRTRLVNVPQARVKETDRIAVMARELSAMGACVEELPDGLVIDGGTLEGAKIHGHGDHRVVMAMTVAALAARGASEIDTAEAAAVTFPGFVELMRSAGARIETAP